jgi:hypothetical protein
VFQLVLPLRECDDPATVESVVEPLQSVADSTDAGAAPTETS